VRGPYKHIHTFHGHLFEDNSFSSLQKKIITLVEKWLAPRADVLISVGRNVGDELRQEGIGPQQPWVSIPPGVQALPKTPKVKARKLIDLPETGLLIGWMARVTSVKNPKLLLEVADRLPNFNFVMAGGGDLLDWVKTNAPANVKVIGWVNAALFWSAVDIAISTSDNEGMPIALIEAQLAGLPVIATDVGSNREIIENGVNGIITKKNSEELVSALNFITAEDSIIQKFGKAGKRQSNQKYQLDSMIKLHQRLYRELLKNKIENK
jgi:glycosyltransferase involved in cell wall biosynthesis